jgi:hypothetical protein
VIALKKGPEHVPASRLLLAISTAFLLLALFVATRMVGQAFGVNLAIEALGLGLYVLVLVVTGYSRRLVPVLTTLLGCSGVLTLALGVELVSFASLLGQDPALLIGILIRFWSVFVEGHIMSRAMSRHLFAGVAVAIAAFTLRYAFQLQATRG